MARNGPVHVTFVSNIPMQCDDTAALFLLACTIERHMQPKGRWSSCLRKSCTHPTWTCWKSDLQLSALNQRVLLYDILTTQNIGPSIYLLRLLERCILKSRTPSQTRQMLKKKKKKPWMCKNSGQTHLFLSYSIYEGVNVSVWSGRNISTLSFLNLIKPIWPVSKFSLALIHAS